MVARSAVARIARRVGADQLPGSLDVSVQTPWQSTAVPGHLHAPPLQRCPPVQRVPQVPQFKSSLEVSVHPLGQSDVGGMHVTVHFDPEQT
jgi:hypothetical protein